MPVPWSWWLTSSYLKLESLLILLLLNELFLHSFVVSTGDEVEPLSASLPVIVLLEVIDVLVDSASNFGGSCHISMLWLVFSNVCRNDVVVFRPCRVVVSINSTCCIRCWARISICFRPIYDGSKSLPVSSSTCSCWKSSSSLYFSVFVIGFAWSITLSTSSLSSWWWSSYIVFIFPPPLKFQCATPMMTRLPYPRTVPWMKIDMDRLSI